MTTAGLGYINTYLSNLGIPYEFMDWTNGFPDTYFVGEYRDIPTLGEGGESETDFILTGTTRSKWIDLETVKETLAGAFPEYGHTAVLPNGWGIMISFDSASPIPSIEEGIKRIEITLKVKEWKGE